MPVRTPSPARLVHVTTRGSVPSLQLYLKTPPHSACIAPLRRVCPVTMHVTATKPKLHATQPEAMVRMRTAATRQLQGSEGPVSYECGRFLEPVVELSGDPRVWRWKSSKRFPSPSKPLCDTLHAARWQPSRSAWPTNAPRASAATHAAMNVSPAPTLSTTFCTAKAGSKCARSSVRVVASLSSATAPDAPHVAIQTTLESCAAQGVEADAAGKDVLVAWSNARR